MRRTGYVRAAGCLYLLFVVFGQIASAQDGSSQNVGFRTEFLNHFDSSTKKMLSLAEAIPADKYAWRPATGVMSVAEVFTHVAEVDLHYLATSLNSKAPADLDPKSLGKLQEKDQVVAAVRRTFEFVRRTVEQMSDSDMEKTTTLYGRSSSYRNVLLQLLHHSSEHVGQTIAYARMNSIVPPWSR